MYKLLAILLVFSAFLCAGVESSELKVESSGLSTFNSQLSTSIERAPPQDAVPWQSRPNRKLSTVQRPASACDGRYFHVMGGYDNVPISQVRRYDPVADTWQVRPMIDHPVYGAAACYSANFNSIFVFGGMGPNSTPRNYVQVMDCFNGNWNGNYDTLLFPDYGNAAVAVGDTIFVLAGEQNPGRFYKYAPLAPLGGRWTRVADCTVVGPYGALCLKGGRIYAAGGWPSDSVFKRYNRATNTWTDLAPLPPNQGRHGFGLDTIFGKIYAYGGGQYWTTATPNCYSYDSASNAWTSEGAMVYSQIGGAFGCLTTTGSPPVGHLHAACGYPSHANYEQGTITAAAIHDVGVTIIMAPPDTVDSNTVVVPTCSLFNYGNSTENYNVQMRIGTYTYNASVFSHVPGTGTYATFTGWTAAPGGNVAVTCSTQLPGDMQTGNDRRTKTVMVRVHDVGTAMILAPSGRVDSGASVVPACSVANYGNVTEASYQVRLKLGGAYNSTATVTNHVPGTRQYVTFPAWIPPYAGSFWASCSTELAADARRANDRLRQSFEVVYPDIGAVEVVNPTGEIQPGPVTPQGRFYNYGASRYQPKVFFKINSSPPYTDSVVLTGGLPVLSDTVISFRSWNAVSGDYTARCSTWMPVDMDPSNNVVAASFSVHLYDVGTAQILSPIGTIDSSSVVVPSARVMNSGDQPATFPVTFRIDSGAVNLYSARDTISGLAGGETTTVFFVPWPKPHRPGNYTTRCSTGFVGDENPTNDARSGAFSVRYLDVGVQQILSPAGAIDSSATIIPSARFKNSGDQSATFPVTFRIDSNGVSAYSCQALVSNLASGDSVIFSFARWDKPHMPGSYSTRCSTDLTGDMNPANNVRSGSFTIYAGGGQVVDTGWVRMNDVPLGGKNKFVKDGGCLASVAQSDQSDGSDMSDIYCLKGNNRCEFYQYSIADNTWATKESIPAFGRSGKKKAVKKGACVTALGSRVYAAKGNNTLEFWSYSPSDGSDKSYPWVQLADIPLGTRNVREGAGAATVQVGDTTFIFLLKGSNTVDFYRYKPGADAWTTMAHAPTGPSGKFFKNGSCIAYDGTSTIYVLKGSYNELFTYDIASNTWTTKVPLPFIGASGKKKKVKDGAGLAYLDGLTYALKGGGTFEFWAFRADSPPWIQKQDLPLGGGKKVKGGGALVATDAKLYALKGNNTLEFYSYTPSSGVWQHAPTGSNAMSSTGVWQHAPTGHSSFAITPNPFSNTATISYVLPNPGDVNLKLYDATGKLVSTLATGYHNAGALSFVVCRSSFASGIYILELETDRTITTRKLILE